MPWGTLFCSRFHLMMHRCTCSLSCYHVLMLKCTCSRFPPMTWCSYFALSNTYDDYFVKHGRHTVLNIRYLKHFRLKVDVTTLYIACLFIFFRAVKFSAKLMAKALSNRVKCTILYATETGKSERFAKTLCEIFKHAFDGKVFVLVSQVATASVKLRLQMFVLFILK